MPAGRGDSRSNWFQQLRKRIKAPHLDFEVAIWEMTSLIIAPKKVFRSIYYHVSHHPF